jgi:hypothetical protein
VVKTFDENGRLLYNEKLRISSMWEGEAVLHCGYKLPI